MPFALKFLIGCVLAFAAVDVAADRGLVPDGTVTLFVARAYLSHAWARPAFLLGWASIGAVLDDHFARYLGR